MSTPFRDIRHDSAAGDGILVFREPRTHVLDQAHPVSPRGILAAAGARIRVFISRAPLTVCVDGVSVVAAFAIDRLRCCLIFL